LACVRHLARQDRWVRAGRWDRTGAKPARRLRENVLGLVAFGRTARALAEKAQGIVSTILAFDPYLSQQVADAYGVTLVELDELLARSDLVSVHAPLTEATFHLLGEREFKLMKPGAVLVNTSRGPVIDEAALARALREGPLGAAGLDVLENEPPGPDCPLLGLDNVTITPHVAAYTEESVADLYRGACQIAIDVIEGRRPRSVVNPDVKERQRQR
jgi:D-3-phosphoglycerate dehydrogenase